MTSAQSTYETAGNYIQRRWLEAICPSSYCRILSAQYVTYPVHNAVPSTGQLLYHALKLETLSPRQPDTEACHGHCFLLRHSPVSCPVPWHRVQKDWISFWIVSGNDSGSVLAWIVCVITTALCKYKLLRNKGLVRISSINQGVVRRLDQWWNIIRSLSYQDPISIRAVLDHIIRIESYMDHCGARVISLWGRY